MCLHQCLNNQPDAVSWCFALWWWWWWWWWWCPSGL